MAKVLVRSEAEFVGDVSKWTGWRGTLADYVVGAGHR